MSIGDDPFKAIKALQDALNPPWMRQMRAMEQAMNPLASASAAAASLRASIGMADNVSAILEAQESLAGTQSVVRNIIEAQRATGMLTATDQVAEIMRAMRADIGTFDPDLVRQLQPFNHFEEIIRPHLADLGAAQASSHLRETVLSSLAFHKVPWETPLGLLAMLEHEALGGTLSWIADPQENTEEESVSLGAFVRRIDKADEKPTITIETQVVCFLCHAAMSCQDKTFEWIGENRGLLKIDVIPLCLSCLGKDPNFLERLYEALPRRTPHRFEVIDGGGQGKAAPDQSKNRDHLRLVKLRKDDNEGPEPDSKS